MAKTKTDKEPTGYEDTPEGDTFGQIGDDNFEPDGTTGTTAAPGPTGTTGQSDGPTGNNDPDDDLFDTPTGTTAPTGQTGQTGGTAPTSTTGETGATGSTATGDTDDVFDTTELESQLEKAKALKKQTEKVDWAGVAEEVGLEGFEGKTFDEFKKGVKKHFEQASEKVEFDLSKYDEETQGIIKFFESGGTRKDLADVTKPYTDYLLKSDEEKVSDYLKNSEKLQTEEEISARIEELIDEGEFDDTVKKINGMIMNRREEIFNEFMKEAEQKTTAIQDKVAEEAEAEKEAMLNVIDDMDDFMGEKLPAKTKAFLREEIKAGLLTKNNNNAQTQVKARLFDLFGQRIMANVEKRLKEASRSGYNSAIEKENGKKFGQAPGANAGGAQSRQFAPDNQDYPSDLGDVSGIDDDAVEGLDQ